MGYDIAPSEVVFTESATHRYVTSGAAILVLRMRWRMVKGSHATDSPRLNTGR